MSEYLIQSTDYHHTEEVGFDFGRQANPGQIYCLTGDIGTGKTVFTKGFARGLSVTEMITSPTFTLVNEYDLEQGRFYHFDVYRISDADEMEAIGFDDYLNTSSIVLIEWADLISEWIPKDAIWIDIAKDLSISEDYRRITVRSTKE